MEFRAFALRGKYKTNYLAFIDILGFKNVLDTKCYNNPNYILELFSEADSAAHRDEFYGVKKLFLSDSILMWTPHRSAILYLIENCESIQKHLFLHGHLVRGVIVKGDHYSGDIESFNTRTKKKLSFPDHLIVSPALVKAYLKEQSLKIPVIKIEGDVLIDMPLVFKKNKK